jgi:lysophospholipase L1-like esterase
MNDPDARPRQSGGSRRWSPGLAYYARENGLLIEAGTKVDCVFIGDSITELWLKRRPDFFGPGMICRGISSQTTPQMLVRFRADVVALKPHIVHIMGGTNDIAGMTGPSSPGVIVDTIATMAELAMVHGIRIVIASITPAIRHPWAPSTDPRPEIQEVNLRLRHYAMHIGASYADYHTVLDDGQGGVAPGLSVGDVHPSGRGYRAMEPVARAAIENARLQPVYTLRSV